MEQCASAGFHVWHDRLHKRVLSFLGTCVQFVHMQVNQGDKWYAPTSQLDALSECCAQSAPQTVPLLKCEPYEGLFVTDRGDKGLTIDISRLVQCKICEATVPRVCMRTHVGQHFLRKECVKGQEEISWPPLAGFVATVSLALPRSRCVTSARMPWSPSCSLIVPVSQLSCPGTLLQKNLEAARARTILYGVPYAPR